MKFLSAMKIGMFLLGLGAALALAPQSRAQSEVAPDHFDGTDSWAAAAAAKVPAPKAKQFPVAATQAARNQKLSTHATPLLASAKNFSESQRPQVLAIQDKRKAQARKPNNQ
jgi:hypothetical protein